MVRLPRAFSRGKTKSCIFIVDFCSFVSFCTTLLFRHSLHTATAVLTRPRGVWVLIHQSRFVWRLLAIPRMPVGVVWGYRQPIGVHKPTRRKT